MKRLTLLMASIIFLHTAHAQIEKGSLFIGGSLGFNNYKTQNTPPSYNPAKQSAWNISPQIGRAIQKNFIVGVQVNAGGNTNESVNTGTTYKNNSTSYGLNFFLRKYYPVASKWMLFGEAGVGGGISTGSNKANDTKVASIKGWNAGLNIVPGISFNVSKKLWLEMSFVSLASVGYSSTKQNAVSPSGEILNSSKTTNFNAGVSVSGLQNLSIGLRWIL